MPKKKKKKGPSLGPIAAGLAPAALALLLSQAVLKPGPGEELEVAGYGVVQCDAVESMEDCHSRYPTGCTNSTPYDPYLNLLKNQLMPPPTPAASVEFLDAEDFEKLDQSWPDGLEKKNHEQFAAHLKDLGEGEVFGIEGFLYDFKKTGKETSNCQIEDEQGDTEGTNVDYHIWVGFDAGLAEVIRSGKKLTPAQKRKTRTGGYIVEMTPHYRATFAEDAWTLSTLRNARGRKVRVVGQLLADNEHNIASQNCAIAKTASQKKLCWRASAWELHPVTQLQVCVKADQSCGDNSADWVQLDQFSP